MELKRAIWISVLLYLATFLVGILVAFFTGTDLTGETGVSTIHWVWSIVLSVIVAGVFSIWYFKDKKIKRNALEGLKLGLTFLAVGIIFDALIFIPYVFTAGSSALVAYYSDPWFYISVILIVLTPVVAGSLIKNRK